LERTNKNEPREMIRDDSREVKVDAELDLMQIKVAKCIEKVFLCFCSLQGG